MKKNPSHQISLEIIAKGIRPTDRSEGKIDGARGKKEIFLFKN
jgi:hypothetical protein